MSTKALTVPNLDALIKADPKLGESVKALQDAQNAAIPDNRVKLPAGLPFDPTRPPL